MTSKTYKSLCFIGPTAVATTNGLIPIRDVKKGDLVYTLDGTARPVLTVGSRVYSGDMVKIYCGGRAVCCTLEHPFFAAYINKIDVDGMYRFPRKVKNAVKLSLKDYLLIPWNLLLSYSDSTELRHTYAKIKDKDFSSNKAGALTAYAQKRDIKAVGCREGVARRIDRVRLLEARNIPVYNLEVEDRHTYTAEFFAVSGCVNPNIHDMT
jgi:hypothetical protein